jgi:hypothetical protein
MPGWREQGARKSDRGNTDTTQGLAKMSFLVSQMALTNN